MLLHLRNRSGRRTYRGFCWHRLGGGEHAHLDARFQFLVRLGHLLDQHLLADDVRSAHNDLIRHQKPETIKPAQGGLSEFFVDCPRHVQISRRRLNWRLEAPDSLGLPAFGFRRHTRGHTMSRLLVVLAVYFWGSSGGCLTVSSVCWITGPNCHPA